MRPGCTNLIIDLLYGDWERLLAGLLLSPPGAAGAAGGDADDGGARSGVGAASASSPQAAASHLVRCLLGSYSCQSQAQESEPAGAASGGPSAAPSSLEAHAALEGRIHVQLGNQVGSS